MDKTMCPKCNKGVDVTDNYCRTCGVNLHEEREGISAMGQVLLYAGSVMLPPLGIFWGMKYIRKSDTTSKIAGYVAIALTVIVLILTVQWTMGFVNGISSQINQVENFAF